MAEYKQSELALSVYRDNPTNMPHFLYEVIAAIKLLCTINCDSPKWVAIVLGYRYRLEIVKAFWQKTFGPE